MELIMIVWKAKDSNFRKHRSHRITSHHIIRHLIYSAAIMYVYSTLSIVECFVLLFLSLLLRFICAISSLRYHWLCFSNSASNEHNRLTVPQQTTVIAIAIATAIQMLNIQSVLCPQYMQQRMFHFQCD